MRISTERRPGFTLLEIILALGIALVLLSALYIAMNNQLTLAQSGREVVEHGKLGRALLTRINTDITSSLGPVPPWIDQNFQAAETTDSSSSTTTDGSSSSTSSSSSTTSSSTPSTSSSSSSSSTTTDETTQQESMPQNASNAAPAINYRIQGGAQYLTVIMSRYPRELDQGMTVSDIRRIDYWLINDGDKIGLGRRQVTKFTSAEEMVDPYSLPNQGNYIIAPEVVSVSFRFWNGSDWQDTWDGSLAGDDGETKLGPPAAVEITLELRAKTGDERTRRFQHIIPIPTANIVQK